MLDSSGISVNSMANVLIEHGEQRYILDAPGLGRYYQKTANRLDEVFRYAEEKGIYIMLVHDYHGIFNSYIGRWASNAEWRSNPYNAANGQLILNGLQLKSEKDIALWLKPVKK